jgi:hypothetical protein
VEIIGESLQQVVLIGNEKRQRVSAKQLIGHRVWHISGAQIERESIFRRAAISVIGCSP